MAVAEYTQSGSISATLGMFTSGGLNLFESQAELDYHILSAPMKHVPWLLTASNNTIKD